ncbi:hypothetical protein LLH06_16740 [Mucilaginibacter daejeonensis]|uniref:hypothetical protein n=1 Tax=Mucilaginibacter daejeonensis TaxID=398049 RepID=UPI001D17B730|nr:hypothetical protein [Mucilaginibacter daejeonensis]UEG55402.1 hypothetical protein LLH06_16740 [Mucilaginibacter daejeonensis]
MATALQVEEMHVLHVVVAVAMAAIVLTIHTHRLILHRQIIREEVVAALQEEVASRVGPVPVLLSTIPLLK